jgi:hypothetical protein
MEMMNAAQKRRVWVGSLGVSGYSTVHHLNFLSHDDLWKRMDCLVFLVGANDMLSFLRYGVTMRPANGEFWERHTDLESLHPAWRRSMLIQRARDAIRTWTGASIYIEDGAGSNYIDRRLARQSGGVLDTVPDLSDPLLAYEQRLRHIIRMCKLSGVRSVFLTQPTLYADRMSADVSSLFWGGEDGQGNYYNISDLRAALDLYNHRLLDVCSDEGIECIDLTVLNGQAHLYYDEFHYNESGARAVARTLANTLSL